MPLETFSSLLDPIAASVAQQPRCFFAEQDIVGSNFWLLMVEHENAHELKYQVTLKN